MNKQEAEKDLRKLFGLPPYNTPSNLCWNDGYFSNSLEHKYGMTIQQLSKLTGIYKP